MAAMLTSYYILAICVITAMDAKTLVKNLQPNSLMNLEGMSYCSLGYSGLHYNNYGCYCGFGGEGTPIDEIDECCMHHDNCYEEAKLSGFCKSDYGEYVTNYAWECTEKDIKCGENKDNPCKAALCECDRKVVKCWGKYKRPSAIKPKCKSD